MSGTVSLRCQPLPYQQWIQEPVKMTGGYPQSSEERLHQTWEWPPCAGPDPDRPEGQAESCSLTPAAHRAHDRPDDAQPHDPRQGEGPRRSRQVSSQPSLRTAHTHTAQRAYEARAHAEAECT